MANRNLRSFKNPFSGLLEIKKKHSFELISADSVAVQSKEVACESSPSCAKQRTTRVYKSFNTLPVSPVISARVYQGTAEGGRVGGRDVPHCNKLSL